MLSASDLAFIVHKLKLDDKFVSIIGCPQHLYKNMTEDHYQIKTYICHNNNHWFPVIYFKQENVLIVLDSFGSQLPRNYKSKVKTLNPKIKIYFSNKRIQTDGVNCGYFSLAYIIIVLKLWKQDKLNIIEKITDISINEVLNVFHKIQKIFVKKSS